MFTEIDKNEGIVLQINKLLNPDSPDEYSTQLIVPN